jgi:capsular polysaccharide biosynthesis protein
MLNHFCVPLNALTSMEMDLSKTETSFDSGNITIAHRARNSADRSVAQPDGAGEIGGNHEGPSSTSRPPIGTLRVVAGIWKRKYWVLLGAVLGLVGGIWYGLAVAASRFEVSAQIIKQQQTAAVRIGPNGEPYRPRLFINSTLMEAATSMKLLQSVAAKSNPRVPAGWLKKTAHIAEDKNTDFATMTLSGYHSPSATVDLANLWASEFVEFSREMQRQESREVRILVEKQVASNQTELQTIEVRLAKFGRDGLLTPELTGDAKQNAADVFEKYESVHAQLATLAEKIDNLRSELLRQSPQADEIRAARIELGLYRTRYTERNPLVIERVERLVALEAENKLLVEEIRKDPSIAASLTAIGAEIYAKIVDLELERGALKRQEGILEKLREQAKQSPEQAMKIAELLESRANLKAAQISLLGRLEEARFFEESAPGYYSIFTPAALDRMSVRSRSMKISVFSLAGLLGGGMCGLMLAMCGALADPRLRTAAEAAAIVGAPLFASVPVDCNPEKAVELGGKLWLRWIGGYAQTKRPRAVWTPAPDKGEEFFWKLLLAQARKLSPALLIVDCGSTRSAALAALPQSKLFNTADLPTPAAMHCPLDDFGPSESAELASLIKRCTESGRAQERAARLARSAQAPLLVLSLHTHTVAFWREQAALLTHSVGPLSGVVATNESSAFLS